MLPSLRNYLGSALTITGIRKSVSSPCWLTSVVSMMMATVLDPLITRVSVIREVVIRIIGSLMSFLLVKVNKSFIIKVMVGRAKVGEVLLLLSNVSNVEFFVIMI